MLSPWIFYIYSFEEKNANLWSFLVVCSLPIILTASGFRPSEYGLNDLIEMLKESEAIPSLEGSRAAHNSHEFAEVEQDLSVCEGLSDGILRENATPRDDHSGTFFQAAGGEWSVPGNHDIVLGYILLPMSQA